METNIEEIGSLLKKASRDFEGKRTQAIRQYADILDGYGKGNLGTRELYSEVVALFAKESIIYLGDVAEEVTNYWKGVARVLNPSDTVRSRASTTSKQATKKRVKKKK